VLSLYQSAPDNLIHVYFGLELLEKVSSEREDINFKLMVARLYNAGVKVRAMEKLFQIDHKTMRRWGKALQSGEAQQVIDVLSGRSARRKLTLEIESYIRMRFGPIYEPHRYDYSKRLREEVSEVFGVSLSRETIRPLLGELKKTLLGEQAPQSDRPPETSNGETSGHCDTEDAVGKSDQGAQTAENQPIQETLRPPAPDHNAKPSPTNSNGVFSHHAGVLMFSSILGGLQTLSEPFGSLWKQWMATLLLGSLNIEQTKLLDWVSLKNLLGRVVPSTYQQRQCLREIAQSDSVPGLLRFNGDELEVSRQSDFYFDPHTKHYTGEAKILKGWCPHIRSADKVMNADYVHTAQGQPLWLSLNDNYQDMRERFTQQMSRFRQESGIQESAVLTWIMDRGIYKMELFEKLIADPHNHLITWEKNFKKDSWDAQGQEGDFIVSKPRNNSRDLRHYHFQYLDRPWFRNPLMRQIVVQATNPDQRTIVVAVLCDDPERRASEVISLIFNRWLQENDFKYLDKHFGVNQITSYDTLSYRDMKDEVQEKQIKSGAYKALEQECRLVKKQLGALLVSQKQKSRKNSRQLKRIEELSEQLKQLEVEKEETQKEISKLGHLIDKNYEKLDTQKKIIMDVLKIIARNVFYKTLALFKEAYDNYRDDHEIFRNLTRAHGVLIPKDREVEVHLYPTYNYPPKVAGIFRTVLEQINQSHPTMPDGSGRALTLKLGSKKGFQLGNPDPSI